MRSVNLGGSVANYWLGCVAQSLYAAAGRWRRHGDSNLLGRRWLDTVGIWLDSAARSLSTAFNIALVATRAHRARGEAKLKGGNNGLGRCLGGPVLSAVVSIGQSGAAGRGDLAALPRARASGGGIATISGKVH